MDDESTRWAAAGIRYSDSLSEERSGWPRICHILALDTLDLIEKASICRGPVGLRCLVRGSIRKCFLAC